MVGMDSTIMSSISYAKLATTVIDDDKHSTNRNEEGCGCKKGEKRKKYELVDYDSLPNYLKHNEFILRHYRSDWPWKETVLSIFSIHNETINVWTHLIGFFVFLVLTLGTVVMIPRESSEINGQIYMGSVTNMSALNDSRCYSDEVWSLPSLVSWYTNESHKGSSMVNKTSVHLKEMINNSFNTTTGAASSSKYTSSERTAATTTLSDEMKEPITRWPFMAFMFGAMLCLFSSSSCHLLSCHSEKCSYVMLRLDYAGITVLIVTSFYPLVYYTFLCHPFFQCLYISSITVFGLVTVVVSLIPAFESPELRVARAALFCCMGLSGLVPIVHMLAIYGHRDEAVLAAAYEVGMGLFYAVGAVVYATQIPERWLPGWFDVVGHSHQLFHVLVIAGAYMHYHAGLVYVQWRDLDGC